MTVAFLGHKNLRKYFLVKILKTSLNTSADNYNIIDIGLQVSLAFH